MGVKSDVIYQQLFILHLVAYTVAFYNILVINNNNRIILIIPVCQRVGCQSLTLFEKKNRKE